MAAPIPNADDEGGRNRRRAALAVLPFLGLGLANLALIVTWGAMEPLWVFLILPPILFVTALTWIAFRTDFLEDR